MGSTPLEVTGMELAPAALRHAMVQSGTTIIVRRTKGCIEVSEGLAGWVRDFGLLAESCG